MIQSNELRIGNILEYAKQNVTILEIQRYNKVELGYFTDSIGFNRNLNDVNIKPIQLTEELLLKFGFEYVGIKGLKGYWLNGICIEKIDSMLIERKNGIGLKTVHQLQNLIYSLTGQELIIKND